MVRTFIQVTALLLTIEAAIFLAKGNLGLSAENIALLASTRYGYNPDLIRNLADQRADTWIGTVLLLLAFVLQMWNALWPVTLGDFDVHRGAALYAVVLSVVIGVGAFFLSREIEAKTVASVNAILEARQQKEKEAILKAQEEQRRKQAGE